MAQAHGSVRDISGVERLLSRSARRPCLPHHANKVGARKPDEPADYRKDYNARKILQLLGGINQDFYPTPVLPPIQQKAGRWHFERRTEGFLAKKQFDVIL